MFIKIDQIILLDGVTNANAVDTKIKGRLLSMLLFSLQKSKMVGKVVLIINLFLYIYLFATEIVQRCLLMYNVDVFESSLQ
jgi:hypothetical protein